MLKVLTPSGIAIGIQNGLGHSEMLAHRLGRQRVLGGRLLMVLGRMENLEFIGLDEGPLEWGILMVEILTILLL